MMQSTPINRSTKSFRAWLIVVSMATMLLVPTVTEGALSEIRLGPVSAMAIHWETEWPTVSLFAGAGLGVAGAIGSPLRNPSLLAGFKMYPHGGDTFQPYLTGMYGWTLRSAGLQPFAGGGAGAAWRFGPERNYRIAIEVDMVLRDTMVPFPSAGFGLAVRL